MTHRRNNDLGTITLRAFVLGLLMVVVFSWFTVFRENRPPRWSLTATSIPVLPYVLLALAVLIINPFLRLVRAVRPFSTVELLVVFLMGMVSNGIVSLGLLSQLVPMVSGPSSQFNYSGVQWDVYVEPYLNEKFFIMGEGTRDAAAAVRDADTACNHARSVLKAARDLTTCREYLAQVQASPGDLDTTAPLRGDVERIARVARRRLDQAEAAWRPYAAANDVQDVLATFEERLERLDAERKTRKETLHERRKPAFDFISEFENGFPAEKRAIPGFVYVFGEGWESYVARFHRFIQGGQALRAVSRADAMLKASESGAALDVPGLRAALDRADALLTGIGDASALLARKAALNAQRDRLDAQRAEEDKRINTLRQQGLYARGDAIEAIRKLVKAQTRIVDDLTRKAQQITETIQVDIDPQIAILERVNVAREGLRSVRAAAVTPVPSDIAVLRARLGASLSLFNSFDATARRYFLGDIAWGVWFRPLFNWGLIVLATYVVLMSLNVLIFRQWAHNEKLIYPLAELPLIMGGADRAGPLGGVSAVFRSGTFWTGFAISASVLAWNHLAGAKIIPNVNPIQLEFGWQGYVDGSVFNALRETRFAVIFTVIGLTFLVPARVSCSMWLWQVIAMGELLIMVWLGLGQSRQSFPFHYTYLMNYQLAQGGGGLLVFASVILWQCRAYVFSAVAPRAVEGLERSERSELRVSSSLFLAGSVALVTMFIWRLNVNWFYAVVIYLLILVLSIGLVRAVAEGGVLGIQAFFNPFHFIRHVFGMDQAWNAPALMAPMWIYVELMFVDIKAFIAPAMANAIKIRDELKIGRLKFHAAVWASILAALVVGCAVHLVLAYDNGSFNMSPWHYRGGVVHVVGFGFIERMMVERPTDVAGMRWWLLAGAVTMVLVILSRRRFNWVLHPIGLIMLINPMMFTFWGSIFLGWCMKSLVSTYGNRDTYQRLRYLAIGLIVGEITLAAVGWHRFDIWWYY